MGRGLATSRVSAAHGRAPNVPVLPPFDRRLIGRRARGKLPGYLDDDTVPKGR